MSTPHDYVAALRYWLRHARVGRNVNTHHLWSGDASGPAFVQAAQAFFDQSLRWGDCPVSVLRSQTAVDHRGLVFRARATEDSATHQLPAVLVSPVGPGDDGRIGHWAHVLKVSALEQGLPTYEFVAEVRACRRAAQHRLLTHPHLGLPVAAWVDVAAGRAFLLLRYFPGRVTTVHAAQFVDVLAGVAALHRAGMAHRDLKPENLRLDAQGRVRIIDFDSWTVSDWDSHTDVVTTLPFRAPEYLATTLLQRASRELNSEALDLWSLGCLALMCEQVTPRAPFLVEPATEKATLEKMVQHVQRQEYLLLGMSARDRATKYWCGSCYGLQLRPENRWSAERWLRHLRARRAP